MQIRRLSVAGALGAVLALAACDQELVDLGGVDASSKSGNELQCPQVLDQHVDNCQSPQCLLEFPSGDVNTGLLQTFTPKVTGVLTQVSVQASNVTTQGAESQVAIWVVDLSDVKDLTDPSYSIINHEIAVASTTMTETLDWQTTGFATPPKLIAGQQYGLYLYETVQPANGAVLMWNAYSNLVPEDPLYVGGSMYIQTGIAWSEQPAYQALTFRTYVTPASCE
jgi:hypothetical protein